MKALVYVEGGKVELQDRPEPTIVASTDVIVKLTHTSVCGTDLHICKGDVATCAPGRVLGHEGVGIVHEVGGSVLHFKKGDAVIISCISSCASCEYCRRGMPSHCTTGGWILGNVVDGTQAEYVRIPHGDCSLYAVPEGVDAASLVSLSDAYPTALECGVLNGRVQPGSTVAIVGAGPVGIAALLTARIYSPAKIIVIDTDGKRLKAASEMGAYATLNNSAADPSTAVMELTGGKGCDTVIEAVGIPETFELCQKLLAPGGVLANVGVHGVKVNLFLEELWSKNITITTRLVDTVAMPMLLELTKAKMLDPGQLITHKFRFNEIENAYKTFGAAAEHGALKVLIEM